MQRFSAILFFFGRGEIHAVKACKDSMMSCWLKVFELSEVLLVTSTEFVISTKLARKVLVVGFDTFYQPCLSFLS